MFSPINDKGIAFGVSISYQVSSQGYLCYLRKVSILSRHVILLRHRWRHLIYLIFSF
jgi:hypothetical protein